MAETTARAASEANFTFKVGELEVDALKVTGYVGTEGLSELFEFRIDLCASDPNLDFASVVGKPAWLAIAHGAGIRYVHGIVSRFERTGEGSRLTYYAAELVPAHWLLTKRYKSRIFQASNCSDMTVPGIVKKVFQDAGIPENAYRLALQGTYPAREYIVQYRETEMDFLSRLMEEEGIYYFFEHTAEGHKMVLADSSVAHVPLPDWAKYPYRSDGGMVPGSEYVYRTRDCREIQIGAVMLDDFDFIKPPLDLKATATGSEYTALEYSDYPGRYLVKDEGTRLAKVRLEEQACARNVVHLAAVVRALVPGFRFTLEEHPTDRLNQEYLITHVAHRARQPQSAEEEAPADAPTRYDADVRTISVAVPYRAPRKTAKPRIVGAQTAFVVGPSGEEIYTDEYGRVKVQFHWDREGVFNENSSCWIRVSQGSAGGQYGAMFLPRVGQEVIVEFLEGDPDRPIVTGRVYNKDQMPAYALPANKTRSYIKTHSSKGGGGTNEVMFEDLKDSEKILIFAQKDYHLRVKNDRVETIEKNHHLTVTEQSYEKVKKKKHVEITTDLNEKVGGKHSHEVTGDLGVKVGGNHSNETTGKIYLKATGDIVIESTAGVTLKCGGNFIKVGSDGVAIIGSMVRINSNPAMAGMAQAVVLVAPEAVTEADTAKPGADKTYSAQATAAEAVQVKQLAATPPEMPPGQEVITSWVEIEMVDEEGQPWKGEYYEITRPDGKIIKGHLDSNGQAHVYLPRNEQVQVSFPRLDALAWEKA